MFQVKYSELPIISAVLINVTGLVFENSKYNRKSRSVKKLVDMIYLFFRTVCIIGRVVK